MKLQFFLDEIVIKDEPHLLEMLSNRYEEKYGAFWLVEKEPVLSLFINGNDACLFYMPESGEGQCWSNNPTYNGDVYDTEEFYIENYQLDDISKENIVPLDKAIKAFVYYYNNKELSNLISWY